MFYVYLLKSTKDSKLYVGYTSNLKKRFEEHQHGLSRATAHRGPFELVYYEAYRSKADAVKRERNLKHFKNTYTRLKQRLIESLQT